MNWLIFGIIFWLSETAWFGFNWEPCCLAERTCDGIAGGMMLYGLGVIIKREVKNWYSKDR